MTRRFGGLLSLVLGTILIVGGGLGVNDASGLVGSPTCQPAAGVANTCPTGTISITEVTKPSATTAGPWTVTITSPAGAGHCTTPTGATVNEVVTVPNNGTASSGELFLFTDPQHATMCKYHLVETTVAGFSTTYDPGQDVTIPLTVGTRTFVRDVTVTNTAVAASSSASSSSAASTSSAPVAARSSSAPLASTGTNTQIRFSLLAGIALCLLGLVLLFAGTIARPFGPGGRRR